MNDETRLAEVIDEFEVAAQRLAHGIKSAPYSPDSCVSLGSMRSSAISLVQVSWRLAHWHDEAAKDVEYLGEDDNGDGRGGIVAAQKLRQAAVALERATEKLAAAQSASSGVRWNPS